MLVNPWSIFSEVTSHYPVLAVEQVPLAFGFEHNLSSTKFDSISYLYTCSDLLSTVGNNVFNSDLSNRSPLDISAYLFTTDTFVQRVISELSVEKFWIEVDNDDATDRIQLYFQLPLIAFNDLKPFLESFVFDDLEPKLINSKISYFGVVYSDLKRVGYKVLATGTPELLDATTDIRSDLAKFAMSTLSNPAFQVGFALSDKKILGESIEIDALKHSRFSSCDMWCKLFDSELFSGMGLSLSPTEINRSFGFQQWSGYTLLSGINHLKLGLNCITNKFVFKLYSGILFAERHQNL